ncbi:MAG TPA: HD domain-containing protein [Gemmatimonadales bacterium]|nr:HD domain-containing protein [Gemmatimonadales bacterium]
MTDLPPWAVVSESRRGHIQRVAELLEHWAVAMGVSPGERARWVRAARLHDALRDGEPELLRDLAPEWSHTPKLQHGPAAAVMAERHGEGDGGVLDAVRYHSVGWAQWEDVGRMLYLADYLEPGRPFRREERRALADRVPRDPRGILFEVARERVRWVIESGHPVLGETFHFWNAIVAGQA